jgi:hypothetical protein
MELEHIVCAMRPTASFFYDMVQDTGPELKSQKEKLLG